MSKLMVIALLAGVIFYATAQTNTQGNMGSSGSTTDKGMDKNSGKHKGSKGTTGHTGYTGHTGHTGHTGPTDTTYHK